MTLPSYVLVSRRHGQHICNVSVERNPWECIPDSSRLIKHCPSLILGCISTSGRRYSGHVNVSSACVNRDIRIRWDIWQMWNFFLHGRGPRHSILKCEPIPCLGSRCTRITSSPFTELNLSRLGVSVTVPPCPHSGMCLECIHGWRMFPMRHPLRDP